MAFQDEELKQLAKGIINRAVNRQMAPLPEPTPAPAVPLLERIRQSVNQLKLRE